MVLRNEDGTPLCVGQLAILEDLQQHIEDIRMRLLHLVEQHHAVGVTPHPLGKLATLAIADIAGRRADHLRDLVPFHILRHIEAR